MISTRAAAAAEVSLDGIMRFKPCSLRARQGAWQTRSSSALDFPRGDLPLPYKSPDAHSVDMDALFRGLLECTFQVAIRLGAKFPGAGIVAAGAFLVGRLLCGKKNG